MSALLKMNFLKVSAANKFASEITPLNFHIIINGDQRVNYSTEVKLVVLNMKI